MKKDHRSIVRRVRLPEPSSTPLVPPLSPSVVYRTVDADELEALYEGRIDGYTYAREGHPNASILADKIDWMEGTSGGTITASGMAAITTALLTMLRQGDHIVASDQLYGRTTRLLQEDLPRLGFSCAFADATKPTSVEAAICSKTRLLLVEVMSNPTLRVADMDAIINIAHKYGLQLVVDNTFTTPRAYRPLARGADMVVHSITKMLGGHSDVTLGYVAARSPESSEALHETAVTWGLTASPFDCWLAERGLNSFELRFDRAQNNAAQLADHLAGLVGVERVLYPGRNDHPDHEIAARLLNGHFGNMVSFCLPGGKEQVNLLARAAADIPFAPTLGDIGTTLSHPASSSHRGLSAAQRARLGITDGFIRVSVGVEDIELLKAEFAAAVGAVSQS